MGPGIFTKYSKQVIGGILVCFLLIAAVGLYFWFRGPIGRETLYTEVNDFFDHDLISFTIEQEIYPIDVEVIQVTIRNDTEDTVVAPALYCPDEWLLETRVDGAWHSMRLRPDISEKHLKWEFPAEEYGANSGPSGIVDWNGGEQRYLCNIARYYRIPLEPGLYRIVFPNMEHRNVAALAVEFRVEGVG
jgi:hypothetical protein